MTNVGTGKTAFVSGASRGIGLACARALAETGVHVVLAARDAAKLEEASREIPNSTWVTIDLSSADSIKEAFAKAGKIDILVNNAAVTKDGLAIRMKKDDWDTVINTNLTGAFLATQQVLHGMMKNRWGRIVNISSGAGLGISLTGIQAYASAKAGQIGLTRQLAHELGPFGITVNNIAPGFVRSNPMTERQWEAMGEAGQRTLMDNIALRRLGSPQDIANAVLFFASDLAGWITGQILSVDGGK